MFDAWAVYSDSADPYLAGQTVNGFACDLDAIDTDVDLQPAREEAISFAAYRIIRHRFANSPGATTTLAEIDALMGELGYDAADTSTDVTTGSAAAVGNRIAECYIEYGLQDGANEANAYANAHYLPVNPPIEPPKPGNPTIADLDRWQPIALVQYVDQAGNVYNSNPPALSPEWGAVLPFALSEADRATYFRDDFGYNVYHDPGAPPRAQGARRGHLQVDVRAGRRLVGPPRPGRRRDDRHLAGEQRPTAAAADDFRRAPGFLRPVERRRAPHGARRQSGDGRALRTADRPARRLHARARGVLGRRPDLRDAARPLVHDPQHGDRPRAVRAPPRRRRRSSSVPLEWDVKAYFTLGGAMHDVAITAWGIKGWYDCIRPLSAIRAMADRGQSSDPLGASYHPDGIPLVPGHIEVVAGGRSRWKAIPARTSARSSSTPGSARRPYRTR